MHTTITPASNVPATNPVIIPMRIVSQTGILLISSRMIRILIKRISFPRRATARQLCHPCYQVGCGPANKVKMPSAIADGRWTVADAPLRLYTMAAKDNAQCIHCGEWSEICVQDGSGKDPAPGDYKWTCPKQKCGKSNTATYMGAGAHLDFCDGTRPVAMPASMIL
jgi:hypothetical protein